MQPDQADVVFDSRMRVMPVETVGAAVVAPSWRSAAATGGVKPLDAHHKMLHEGAVLSSHLKNYEKCIINYSNAAKRFFSASDDFIISTGYPSKYRPQLTDAGVQAASAVATAAAAQALVIAAEAPAGPASASGSIEVPCEEREVPASNVASSRTESQSAFVREAEKPALPLQGPLGAVHMFPAVPGTPVLAAGGGLTEIVPDDILVPSQHQQLFRHDEQRRLIAAGRDDLAAAFSERLLPALQLWAATYDECKLLLPQVERMRLTANKVRGELETAKAKVLEAEADQPLVPAAALESAGALPRVLAQTEVGGELVAAPAAAERQELYNKEQQETDAELAFELSEKVLRDKLSWLMRAGGALKAMAAAAAAAALRAAAAEGGPGQAPGGTAAGDLRAPKVELLQPFPEHVLARLRGEHLPTLPQLVQSDIIRLTRWANRFREAMATHAAATAAAAGAEMLAAAAAPPQPGAAAAAVQMASELVPPAGGIDDLTRTDDPDSQAGGAADVEFSVPAAGTASTAAPAVDLLSSANTPAGGSGSSTDGGVGGMAAELQQVAEASQVPLDLLAAAVAADVEDQEVAAAAATRVETAWRLLHDASVVGSKEEAVLVPAVKRHIDSTAAQLLECQLHQLQDVLRELEQVSPSSPGFDLAVLEVLEVLAAHGKELEVNILPVLSSNAPLPVLHDLARQYRGAAATAPTRPHGWFLGATDADPGGEAKGGAAASAAAATAAALRKLLGRPARAGVALVDAASDLARFGPGKVPGKV